jgi:hypothetical protein
MLAVLALVRICHLIDALESKIPQDVPSDLNGFLRSKEGVLLNDPTVTVAELRLEELRQEAKKHWKLTQIRRESTRTSSKFTDRKGSTPAAQKLTKNK